MRCWVSSSSNVSVLGRYLAAWQICPAGETLPGRLNEFYQALLEANKSCNLTRITAYRDFLYKHIADSLLAAAAWPELQREALQVADVGCGGGFPGLPLALAFPQLRCTEIDRTGKKIACVRGFIERLGLDNCEAVHGNARELSRLEQYQSRYEVVVSRAVADTPALIRDCRGFLKARDGVLIVCKTPDQIGEERQLVEREAAKARLTVRASEIYELPENLGRRQFWLLTNTSYPD